MRKETTGSPKFPCYPLVPALLSDPGGAAALALTRPQLLPSLIGDRVGFPIFPTDGYPHGPRHSPFRGSITRPASSLHPASHPPLLMMHAGSLLSCWLGFAQVGLAANLTHWITLTSFLLAPSPRHGLSWRDTNFRWRDFHIAREWVEFQKALVIYLKQ